MATIADMSVDSRTPLSGSPIGRAIDRWIFVYMAASFVVITLIGFIPDSLDKIAAVKAGARAPFPLVMHVHAVLMGSFLLLVLAQTTLAATGKLDTHRWLGRLAMVLVPALVLAGFILVPTIYHSAWNAAQSAPPAARAELQQVVLRRDNIMLLQLRIGIRRGEELLELAVAARGRADPDCGDRLGRRRRRRLRGRRRQDGRLGRRGRLRVGGFGLLHRGQGTRGLPGASGPATSARGGRRRTRSRPRAYRRRR